MLKIGKLDNELLKQIVFDKIKYKRDEVLTRPGIGEDCAVLDYGDYECVLSTDPITAAIEKIGSLAVHISCNDIASNGIEPIGLLLTVLLPEGTTKEDIEVLMAQAAEAAEDLKVEIIGGHTEITSTVSQPVIVSTAVGKGPIGGSQNPEQMKAGDLIYITKNAGLEGTGIMATDKPDDIKQILNDKEYEEAVRMLDHVSVVKEGIIGGRIGTSGMHDITEGGVLGAVWEMCSISGTGAIININDIPVSPITRKICHAFNLNPLRLISSGSMMIVISPDKSKELEKEMADANIKLTQIGTVTSKDDGDEITPPGSDEIYKFWDM